MTTHPKIEAAQAQLDDAERRLKVEMDAISARVRIEWEDRGGCLRCNGIGYVCTWSTMDGDCYNEWGRCPGHPEGEKIYSYGHGRMDCPVRDRQALYARLRGYYAAAIENGGKCDLDLPEDLTDPFKVEESTVWPGEFHLIYTRAVPCTAATVGPVPGIKLHYTRGQCNMPTPPLPAMPLPMLSDERARVEALEEEVQLAAAMLASDKVLWQIALGSTVEVVRGRKVAKGTKGVVEWMGDGFKPSNYRAAKLRLGLRVEGQAALVYIDASNCQVSTPAATNKLRVDEPGLVSEWMTGSARQVEWACSIRDKAILNGTATKEDLAHNDARFWIDNRERFKKKGRCA